MEMKGPSALYCQWKGTSLSRTDLDDGNAGEMKKLRGGGGLCL